MPINGNTNQQILVQALGGGPAYPATQSLQGQAGYPSAGPLKGATIPYWSYGAGKPTFTAPYGSLYTDTNAISQGTNGYYIFLPSSAGIGTWQNIQNALSSFIRTLNGETGDVTIVGGSNVVVSPAGQNITIGVTGVVTAVNVTAPITNTGTATVPNIGLTSPLPVTNGGTGISAPTNNTFLTVNGSGAIVSTVAIPLPIAQGGTGTTTPGNVAGNGITITGSFPTQTIGITAPVSIANGGTGSTTQNFVDLTTAQTAAGAKTWSGLGTFNAGATAVGNIDAHATGQVGAIFGFPAGGDLGALRAPGVGYIALGTTTTQGGQFGYDESVPTYNFYGNGITAPSLFGQWKKTGIEVNNGSVKAFAAGVTPAGSIVPGDLFIARSSGVAAIKMGIDGSGAGHGGQITFGVNADAFDFYNNGTSPALLAQLDVNGLTMGTVRYGNSTATTVGAAGTAAALPANPLGYILMSIGGVTCKIPYYNA